MFKLQVLKNALAIASSTAIALSVSSAWGEEYYRWRDAEGGIHYGSSPPQGVDAEKVKIHAGKGQPAAPQHSSTDDGASDEASSKTPETPEQAQKRREMLALQKKECEQEKKRLSTLKAGKPIRMKQEDGSTKYLTKEEIAAEAERSARYINDTCN